MIKYTKDAKEKIEREMAWALHIHDYLGYHCTAVQLSIAREELEDDKAFDKGGKELENLIRQKGEK